jgi:hypothetical protein
MKECLKDGRLLCELIHKIALGKIRIESIIANLVGTMKDRSSVALTPFHMRENLFHFCKTAEIYGVKATFSIADTVENREMNNLYSFLHDLSKLVIM